MKKVPNVIAYPVIAFFLYAFAAMYVIGDDKTDAGTRFLVAICGFFILSISAVIGYNNDN